MQRLRCVLAVCAVFCTLEILYLETGFSNTNLSILFKRKEFGNKVFDKKEYISTANVPGIKSGFDKASLHTMEYENGDKVPGNKVEFGMASLDTTEHINEVKTQGNRSVFITLPSAIPTDDWKSYDKVVITTWDNTLMSDVLTCCFQYQNGATKQILSTKTKGTGDFTSRRYFCDISLDNGELPRKVTLIDSTISDCSNKLNFIDIFYPVRKPGKFAICTKIVYGKLDPLRLVEWFEYQKLMGVDRVYTFYGNNFFDYESRKVFSLYEKNGLLQTFNIGTPPQRTEGMEKILAAYKEMPWSFNDQNVATYNCYYKMIGYDVASILDVDEFIVVRENVTVKSYFYEKLFKSSKWAIIMLHVEFFITDWGKSENHSSLVTRAYLKRTKPLWNTIKYVFVPSRVDASSINTHYAKPTTQFKIYPDSPVRETTVHHYRTFSNRLRRHGHLERITDYQMKRYGLELEERVHDVLNAL